MQNYISISRLGKLFLMELHLHRKMYLTISIITLAGIILQIITIISRGRGAIHPFPFQSFPDWLIYIAPFALYNFVYHPVKGLTYAMLPATSFEKVLSAWIQCVLVVPIVIYATSSLSALLADLAGIAVRWDTHWGTRHPITFFENYLRCIMIQSLAFWGVFWFKHRKIAKTTLTLCLIGLGIVTILSLILGLSQSYLIDPQSSNSVFRIIYSLLSPLGYFGYLILPILPWALAFFKFRRTQI